jgi:hypothetical protein
MGGKGDILTDLHVSLDELTSVVRSNPSLRGMLVGYLAEQKLHALFEGDPRITGLRKDDDHDRTKKGDLVVSYKGVDFRIESKALQTNSIRTDEHGNYRGKVQCDASDRRKVKLPGGRVIETTCLLVGEFDVLAAGLFGFRQKWEFAFALNRDLPRSSHKGYKPFVRKHLLKTLVDVSLPIEPPFVADPFELLERLYREQRR